MLRVVLRRASPSLSVVRCVGATHVVHQRHGTSPSVTVITPQHQQPPLYRTRLVSSTSAPTTATTISASAPSTTAPPRPLEGPVNFDDYQQAYRPLSTFRVCARTSHRRATKLSHHNITHNQQNTTAIWNILTDLGCWLVLVGSIRSFEHWLCFSCARFAGWSPERDPCSS
jgi:hypothetical protein